MRVVTPPARRADRDATQESGAPGWWRLEPVDGPVFTTGWYLLTASDGARIDRLGPRDVASPPGARVRRDRVVLVERPIDAFDVHVIGVHALDEHALDEHVVGNLRRVPPPVGIARITRASAMFAMLASFADPAVGGGAAVLRVAVRFLARCVAFGPTTGARWLLEAYYLSLGSGERHDGDFWRLAEHAWPRRSDALRLVPKHQLAAHALGAGRVAWTAEEGDPRFLIGRADGRSPVLKAGWYRLRGRVRVLAGEVAAPGFHVCNSRGDAQSLYLAVPATAAGDTAAIDRPVLFTHDVTLLHFDPTVRPAQFELQGFSLTRLGRVQWMLRLLGELHGSPGQSGLLRATANLLLRGRLREAGLLLSTRYQAAGQQQVGSYDLWVQRYDRPGQSELQALAGQGAALAAGGPLISVLLPTYDTPEPWLRRCIDSVLAQAYPHWELCIADDASTQPHVREVLSEYQARDARIRVALRSVNGHICDASNTALDMARGRFIGLLDHDDELAPHALLEMARAIRDRPASRLLYSDEDKLDASGRRVQPYFKPDWNPDLLRSQNYVCHFSVIETALVREVQGFRRGFEGSQDHDLVLRCSERLDPNEIHHVAKVLYHWRAIPGSTALERQAKDYAGAAGCRAVAEHLARAQTGASAEMLPHGHYRVRWPLPSPAPRVSIIIPTRDRLELLRTCVESLLSLTRYPDFECVVVDNQSSDPETLAYLQRIGNDERVRTLRYDAPFNYSAINNWAVARCDGDVLCLLNNDTEVVSAHWLEELVSHAVRPDIGAVGAMLQYPDGTIQHAGVILGLGGIANHAYTRQPVGHAGHGSRALVAQNLSAVTGACLAVRRSVYAQVGGLDEQLAVAFNDIDFCLRIQAAGLRNVWTPFSVLVHHESASRGSEDTLAKQQRFVQEVELMQARWGGMLRQDPAYNPNLSLDSVTSALAFPPRLSGYSNHP